MARGSGYVLVVITAVGCGYCEQMKQSWPQTKQVLEKTFPGLRIVEVQQPRVTTVYTGPYPKNLNVWGVWFPTLLLVPASEWSPSATIQNGAVYNGTYDARAGRVVNTGKQTLTAAPITAWLNARV
jgi:hypothetical protein